MAQNTISDSHIAVFSRKKKKKKKKKRVKIIPRKCHSQEAQPSHKAPITTAADDNFYLFIYLFIYFSEKKSLDFSCESSTKQTIHMKSQDLFSLKIKKKKIECRLLQILLGDLRVKRRRDEE